MNGETTAERRLAEEAYNIEMENIRIRFGVDSFGRRTYVEDEGSTEQRREYDIAVEAARKKLEDLTRPQR
jgi:hypothetical protein